MMRAFIFVVCIFVCLQLFGCGGSSPTLATIGDEKITLREFEDNYAKNNGGWENSVNSTMENREQFLDLLIKFRMKVKEAHTLGLEKDTSIISEMKTYTNSVAQTYLIEKDIIEPGIKKLYDRKNEEIHACHILLRVTPSASPEDTAAIYKRAMNIIAQIPEVPFDTLAFKYSEDPSGKKNLGDLGYFSGGRMAPEFEDACYRLKPGEYTHQPVRTGFGYHIIKVLDRRPARGSIRISHILFQFNSARTDTTETRDTAWSVYNRLEKGENFSELAKIFSKDPGSKSKGGDIGYYEFERIPPLASDILYRTEIDSITTPVRFNYGYHIFKVMDKKGMASFEDMQNELKSQYQQSRQKSDIAAYTDILRKKYKVTIDSSAVASLISSIDTTKFATDETWKDTLSAKLLMRPIIYTAGDSLTIDELASMVIGSDENRRTKLTSADMWQLVQKAAGTAALRQHARVSMDRFPVLARFMKEYENGVLIYRIEQDEVWKKVMINDSLLREYYNLHRGNYRWPDRVNLAEIYILKDSTAKAVYKELKRKKDFTEMAREYTNRAGYREKNGEWGLQPFSLNELTRRASKMAVDSVSAPFKYESGWSIIKTLAIDSARLKTFEEATSEVAGAYQEDATKRREREWIESLYKKYPVKIEKEVLAKAFKRKSS